MLLVATSAAVGLALVMPPSLPHATVTLQAAAAVAPTSSSAASLLFPPTTLIAARGAPASFDLSSMLDDIDDQAASSDAATKAAAMRAATQEEEKLKTERAAITIKRMDETEVAKQRENERSAYPIHSPVSIVCTHPFADSRAHVRIRCSQSSRPACRSAKTVSGAAANLDVSPLFPRTQGARKQRLASERVLTMCFFCFALSVCLRCTAYSAPSGGLRPHS